MAIETTNTAPGSAGQNGALGERWELVTADDGHMFIATAGDIVCHQDPNHAAGDEWDARNFRLMAAAPQMLDALRCLPTEWLRSGVASDPRSDGIRIEMRIVGTTYEAEMTVGDLRAIRTAIAAATGEAV